MTPERFSKLYEIIKAIPIDKWANKNGDKYHGYYIECGPLRLVQDGSVLVNNLNQDFTWRQKRKLRKYYLEVEQEIAIRVLQRKFDVA